MEGGQGRRARAGRGHARLNHARALANAAEANGFAAELEFHRELLRPGVARHDRLNRMAGVFSRGAEQRRRLDDARADVIHRHSHADTPGRANEGRTRRQIQRALGEGDHLPGIRQAGPAGAGIGVAGIHDHDLRRSPFHTLDTNLHGRGANLVRGEHAGDRRGRFRNDEREIALQPLVRALARAELLDIAKHAAGAKAPGRDDGTRNFFELHFHFKN